MMRHLLGRLDRRVGISLPLVALAYLWLVLPVLLRFLGHRPMEYSHAGAAEFGAMECTALVVIAVLPASVYDVVKRKWHGALAVPLSLGIYFVLSALFQLLSDSGRVVLIE